MEGVTLIMGGGGLGVALLAWLGNALFVRLTDTLDRTAERLEHVATMTAEHGARLSALERGK
jgi:shikimate 5-dehydrogenase